MTKRALENDLCQSYEVVVSKSNLSQGGTLCLFLRKSDVPATVNQVSHEFCVLSFVILYYS